MKTIQGQLVDIHKQEIYPAKISIIQGAIHKIERLSAAPSSYICPGFVDAHVHIESSMLLPSEFARAAVTHGTLATVSDPHEIANVLGIDGVQYMLNNAAQVPFYFAFGAPSCVPATCFETAGATLTAKMVEGLLEDPNIYYLSEVMNYPGVIARDSELMAMIASANRLNKPVDGHAPGLQGDEMLKYVSAGISTDHECFSYNEALGKLKAGMKIIIREGSAAKNYQALIPLLAEYPERIMFCSDDKHPNDLVLGHINRLCARAIADGYDLFSVLRAASLNPALHYNLPLGLLREGDNADFLVLKDLESMEVTQSYIKGELVADKTSGSENSSLISSVPTKAVNKWHSYPLSAKDFSYVPNNSNDCLTLRCIEVFDGQLVTGEKLVALDSVESNLESDLSKDVLKISVVNRYQQASPAVAYVHGVGLTQGAIASSVAHDSHNIVAIGVDDRSLSAVVNLLMEHKGGVAAGYYQGQQFCSSILPLPVAGLMSLDPANIVAKQYEEVEAFAKNLGTKLQAPFMTLSFLALLVIPSLKLSDKGLFDGRTFSFTSLQIS